MDKETWSYIERNQQNLNEVVMASNRPLPEKEGCESLIETITCNVNLSFGPTPNIYDKPTEELHETTQEQGSTQDQDETKTEQMSHTPTVHSTTTTQHSYGEVEVQPREEGGIWVCSLETTKRWRDGLLKEVEDEGAFIIAKEAKAPEPIDFGIEAEKGYREQLSVKITEAAIKELEHEVQRITKNPTLRMISWGPSKPNNLDRLEEEGAEQLSGGGSAASSSEGGEAPERVRGGLSRNLESREEHALIALTEMGMCPVLTVKNPSPHVDRYNSEERDADGGECMQVKSEAPSETPHLPTKDEDTKKMVIPVEAAHVSQPVDNTAHPATDDRKQPHKSEQDEQDQYHAKWMHVAGVDPKAKRYCLDKQAFHTDTSLEQEHFEVYTLLVPTGKSGVGGPTGFFTHPSGKHFYDTRETPMGEPVDATAVVCQGSAVLFNSWTLHAGLGIRTKRNIDHTPVFFMFAPEGTDSLNKYTPIGAVHYTVDVYNFNNTNTTKHTRKTSANFNRRAKYSQSVLYRPFFRIELLDIMRSNNMFLAPAVRQYEKKYNTTLSGGCIKTAGDWQTYYNKYNTYPLPYRLTADAPTVQHIRELAEKHGPDKIDYTEVIAAHNKRLDEEDERQKTMKHHVAPTGGRKSFEVLAVEQITDLALKLGVEKGTEKYNTMHNTKVKLCSVKLWVKYFRKYGVYMYPKWYKARKPTVHSTKRKLQRRNRDYSSDDDDNDHGDDDDGAEKHPQTSSTSRRSTPSRLTTHDNKQNTKAKRAPPKRKPWRRKPGATSPAAKKRKLKQHLTTTKKSNTKSNHQVGTSRTDGEQRGGSRRQVGERPPNYFESSTSDGERDTSKRKRNSPKRNKPFQRNKNTSTTTTTATTTTSTTLPRSCTKRTPTTTQGKMKEELSIEGINDLVSISEKHGGPDALKIINTKYSLNITLRDVYRYRQFYHQGYCRNGTASTDQRQHLPKKLHTLDFVTLGTSDASDGCSPTTAIFSNDGAHSPQQMQEQCQEEDEKDDEENEDVEEKEESEDSGESVQCRKSGKKQQHARDGEDEDSSESDGSPITPILRTQADFTPYVSETDSDDEESIEDEILQDTPPHVDVMDEEL